MIAMTTNAHTIFSNIFKNLLIEVLSIFRTTELFCLF